MDSLLSCVLFGGESYQELLIMRGGHVLGLLDRVRKSNKSKKEEIDVVIELSRWNLGR
jgi:hypothetical protein